MKKIGDIMDEDGFLLNSEEPTEGHFVRFGQKLRAQNRRKLIRKQSFAFARIAAVILVVVISAFWIKSHSYDTSQKEIQLAGQMKNMEVNEAEQFYSRMLELGYDNIRKIKFPDESQKAKVLEEVSQKDETIVKIKEDLQNDPSNEMAQEAMINYYQTRLEVINHIVENLKQALNNNS